jgi:hypothetical protein
LQNFRAKALFFTQDSEQQVLGAHVLVPSRSASSVAKFRMRLDSWLSGTSTDVEMRSRIVMRDSISLRMDSIEPWERRKRLARALSSRIKPSNKCSVSMYGDCRTGWPRTAQRI